MNVEQIFKETISGKVKVITEEQAKQILTEYGLKVPDYALVNSADEGVTKLPVLLIITAVSVAPSTCQK